MLKNIPNLSLFAGFYAGIWSIFLALFVLFLYHSGLPFHMVISDALLSTLMLALLLLPLWYIIRYSGKENQFNLRLLLHFLAGLAFLTGIWLFGSVSLLRSLYYEQGFYLEFLEGSFYFRLFFAVLMGMVVFLGFSSLNLMRATREAALRETNLKNLVQQTELQALKNQLNPHFIYNSLNSISSLTITNPAKAQQMLIRLSDFLRYALRQDATQLTSLEQELENVRLYLQIEQVRFGEKMLYEFRVDPQHMDARLPVMILQPLFENAVKHGVQRSAGNGIIVLQSESTAQGVKLTLSNPYDAQFARFRGEGVGLENIRNRLRVIYGNGHLLQVKAGEGAFHASLLLPQAGS
jgi:two-component system, LytTR family, sensor kinase